MRGTVLYGTGDIRFEDTPEPKITKPTDAIIRLAATCVCGSDLWSYRGIRALYEVFSDGVLWYRFPAAISRMRHVTLPRGGKTP